MPRIETTDAQKKQEDELIVAITAAAEAMGRAMKDINRRLQACLPDSETLESILLKLEAESEPTARGSSTAGEQRASEPAL